MVDMMQPISRAYYCSNQLDTLEALLVYALLVSVGACLHFQGSDVGYDATDITCLLLF